MTELPITPGDQGVAAVDTASTRAFMIDGVIVVDVEKAVTAPGRTVLISGDRIARIGPQGTVAIPQGAHIVDGSGLYLMPGLIDAHVHFMSAPAFGRLCIANGVTAVRDMGLPTGAALQLRDQLNGGSLLGPEMVATGAILDGSPPLIPALSLGVGTPDEGREAVRRQAEAGVDMIKVYSTLHRDTLAAIVDEARMRGLKTVGHVPEEVYIEDAAAIGMASCEHLFGFEKVIARLLGEPVNLTYAGMGAGAGYFARLSEVDAAALRSTFERLRASGTTACPTIVVFKAGTRIDALRAGNFPNSEYVTPDVLSIWASQWSSQAELPAFIWQGWARMVSELHRAGVPLMLGTDLLAPGIIAGFSLHEEMAIWQEAGIPAPDVLRSATIVPARFMGLGDRLGTVSQGKTASLVLVRANPLEDIGNARQIESVLLRGRYFAREDLDRLLGEVKTLSPKD